MVSKHLCTGFGFAFDSYDLSHGLCAAKCFILLNVLCHYEKWQNTENKYINI